MDIKLKDFEGPLDLLLHLVSQYKVDIYEVPIVEVIEQYLNYIETLQVMKLEVAGDYMLMASQLMLIKSRRLLPKVVEHIEEEDLEQDLLEKIEEYSRFKAVSQALAKQHDQRAKWYSKPKQELIFEDAILQEDKTVMDLFLAFSNIMAAKRAVLKNNHTVIERDDYKIEDMMASIKQRLEKENVISLSAIFEECQTLNEVISIFLASLELIKLHVVFVEQLSNFGDIILRKEKR
ncbi:TPA: segregation/condensation protein A [Streptococcus pyogenes]|uniref:Segregation and condensation protein A n=1 Tax=Streptococcus pyogenes serotype M5 (strain Manfredo) TaxID=160491 RepID=SCPA_STRPG|nr:segregation/condensation protein A [Streptococcus pyogenes]A2RG92.1 RecName: Full=Segregation and condensation protein A [Streptococcus pyogenes str. Manfredo]ESA47408.1 ScpA/B protein [Streptococcus pyogenes GA40468]HER4661166.1 segregation/condensation protein A [Streptococcus pyogenes NGAS428]HER4780303.1 segregation/condensation protein A [Streptococcus pyogenes NGAS148]AIQ02339.1 Segregation and condensation protein A [Streptococcus pyogenes]NSX74217.1 segregation/condensation protein